MRDLQPEQPSVGGAPHACGRDQMTRDMPRAVVEVAGIARAEQFPADHAAIQPERSQPLDVRREPQRHSGWVTIA